MTFLLLPPVSPPSGSKREHSGDLRRFRPRLALGYQDELARLSRQLEGVPTERAEQLLAEAIGIADRRIAQYESLGLALADLLPTVRWVTAIRVLRDLLIQGWTLRTDDEGVLLKAPGATSGTDPEIEKAAVRRSFAFARNAQLAEASASRFIRGLERRGVKTLFADGPDLATRIRHHGAAAIPARTRAGRTAQPSSVSWWP